MVAIGQHLLQHQPAFIHAPGARQGLGHPETTRAERAFQRAQAIVGCLCGIVAMHQRVAGEVLLDAVDGVENARISCAGELGEHHQKRASIHSLAAIVLNETFLFLVPALLHNLHINLRARIHPLYHRSGQAALSGQAQRPIESHPGHDSRVDKVLASPAHLPDALVGLVPVSLQPLEQATEVCPQVIRDGVIAVIDIDCIHQLAVDIQLILFIRAIADAHRATLAISFQVIEGDLGQIVLAVDGIHWL